MTSAHWLANLFLFCVVIKYDEQRQLWVEAILNCRSTGVESMAANLEVKRPHLIRAQEEERTSRKWGRAINPPNPHSVTLKVCSQACTSSISQTLLNFPKHCHQLGTKCSDTLAYGWHFLFKPTSDNYYQKKILNTENKYWWCKKLKSLCTVTRNINVAVTVQGGGNGTGQTDMAVSLKKKVKNKITVWPSKFTLGV